jgi:hypothetical protein
MVDRPCTSGPPPVFARWDAVGGAEHPAEVRAVGKAPAGADGADRSRPQPGIGQVTPAAVQAATADPGRDGHVVLLKVFLADQGDKPALLANIRAIQAWAEEEQRRGIRLVEDYLRTGGPFPDRLHLIALTVRFLGFEWDAAVHRWARWAEQEVQRWARRPRRRAQPGRLRGLPAARPGAAPAGRGHQPRQGHPCPIPPKRLILRRPRRRQPPSRPGDHPRCLGRPMPIAPLARRGNLSGARFASGWRPVCLQGCSAVASTGGWDRRTRRRGSAAAAAPAGWPGGSDQVRAEAEGSRTRCLRAANATLFQVSYIPVVARAWAGRVTARTTPADRR